MATSLYGDCSTHHDAAISTSGRVVAPEPSSLKGLEDVKVHQYNGMKVFKKVIATCSRSLVNQLSNQQYVVFSLVKQEDLARIDKVRVDIGRSLRFTYCSSEEQLIVKLLPSARHERAHIGLGSILLYKTFGMGMPARALIGDGSKRCKGRSCSKEGDSCFLPSGVSSSLNDWPTIVFESGGSESLRRLRNDASWWLVNSGGKVKAVIIVSFELRGNTITIEKWELAKYGEEELTRPLTRYLQQNPEIPQKIQQLVLQPGRLSGAPLVLNFNMIFLREPIAPEMDFVYTEQDLLEWGSDLWINEQ